MHPSKLMKPFIRTFCCFEQIPPASSAGSPAFQYAQQTAAARRDRYHTNRVNAEQRRLGALPELDAGSIVVVRHPVYLGAVMRHRNFAFFGIIMRRSQRVSSCVNTPYNQHISNCVA